ncbi:hypothetical protein BASA62_007957 [Batrachochytrium salamandrivorans]|nr:hypothetical protein BASA62_007957 [Batrachochytrium salamandrivorans]
MSWFNSVDPTKLAGSIGSLASKIQTIAESTLQQEGFNQSDGVHSQKDGGEGATNSIKYHNNDSNDGNDGNDGSDIIKEPDGEMSKEYIKEAVMEYTQEDDTARLPAYAHAHAHAHAHNNAHNNACSSPTRDNADQTSSSMSNLKSQPNQPSQETYNQVETFPQSDQPNQPLDRPHQVQTTHSSSSAETGPPSSAAHVSESEARIQLLHEKLLKAAAYIKRLNEENRDLSAKISEFEQVSVNSNPLHADNLTTDHSEVAQRELQSSDDSQVIKEELIMVRLQVKELDDTLAITRTQCEELRVELNKSQENAALVQNNHANALLSEHSQTQALEIEVDQVRTLLAETVDDNKRLQTEIMALEQTNREFILQRQEESMDYEARIKHAADRMIQLETQNDLLEKSIEATHLQSNEKYESIIAQMQKELDSMRLPTETLSFPSENSDTLVSEAPILDASDDIEKHPSPISRTKSPQPPLHSKEVNVAHKATSLDIPITLVETRNSLDLAEFGLLKTKLSETIRLHEEQTQQWEDEISDMKADLDAAEATRILLEQRLKDADQKLSATSDSNSTAHSKMLSNDPSDGTPAHVSSSTEILHAVGANAQETEGWGDENGWGEFKDDPAMENYSNNYVGENDPDSHHSPSSKDRFDSESRINALQVQLQDAIEARDNLQTIISTHEASRASFVNMNIEEIDELRAERDRLLEQLEVACLQYTNFERESEAHKAKMEINLEALKDTHEIALLEGTQHRASLEKELEDAYEKLNAVHLQLQESTLALNDIREQNKEKSLQEKTIFESSDSTQEHESIVAQLNLQISDLKDHLESLTVSSKAREDEITGRLATVKALAAEKIKRLMSENQRLSSTMTDPTASTTFRKGSPTLNSAVSPVSEVDAAAFTALQQSFEETQEQHSIQLQRATLLSTQIEAEQARSSQLQSSIHSLQELGEKDGQHIKALQATISELKKTMSDNKIQHQAEMADAVALAEARVVQIKSDLDTSLLQLSSHVENVSALEHQITMLHQQVHTLEQQLKDQVLTIQALNDKNDMQIADFELATEQQVAYHKEELSELTASMHKQAKEDALALQRAIQERDDAISSLAPNSELQLSIASKDMELQQQAARTIELENQVQELQLQILNQNQTLAEMKNGPSQLGDPEWLEALIQVLLMARTAHSGLNLDAAAPALMHDSISLQLRESLSSIWEYIAELRDSLDSQYKLLNDTTTQFEQERSELQHSIVQHQERASELSNQVDQVQPMLVQQQALAQQLADENEQLYGERTLLMDKLTSMKNAIGPKLQAEMDECHRLRGDLAAAQEHSTSLQVQIQSLTDAIHLAENDSTTALTDTSRLQSELTEARDHAERQQTELERLRQFFESLEKEQEQWVQAADETRTARHQADAATAEAREELALMVQKVDTLTAKVEQGQISQINLQRVLEQFEASKDSEITFAVDAVTRKLMEANAAIDGFRERADRAETQLAELTIQLKSGSNMEKDLQERNALVGKLRHDLVQVQTHLAEAMRRMRNGGADASVDRKLIANLLVSLLSSPRGDSKRFEILGLIANILRFENDEKVKVGLLRRHPDMLDGSVKPHTETVMGASETFMDMWIGFLVNESNSKSGTAQSPNQQDSSISPLLQSTLSPRLSVSSERGQPLIPHPLSTGTGFGSSTPSLSIPSSPLTPTASSTGNVSVAAAPTPPPAATSIFSNIFGRG